VTVGISEQPTERIFIHT